MIKNKELIHTCLHYLQTLSLGERIIFKTAKKDREISVERGEGEGIECLKMALSIEVLRLGVRQS